jgi:hypothetical protein
VGIDSFLNRKGSFSACVRQVGGSWQIIAARANSIRTQNGEDDFNDQISTVSSSIKLYRSPQVLYQPPPAAGYNSAKIDKFLPDYQTHQPFTKQPVNIYPPQPRLSSSSKKPNIDTKTTV